MDEYQEIVRMRENIIEDIRSLSETTLGKALAREALDQIETELKAAREALS